MKPLRVSYHNDSLNSVLAKLGITTKPRERDTLQGKIVIVPGGEQFAASADETWKWLVSTGRIVYTDHPDQAKRRARR